MWFGNHVPPGQPAQGEFSSVRGHARRLAGTTRSEVTAIGSGKTIGIIFDVKRLDKSIIIVCVVWRAAQGEAIRSVVDMVLAGKDVQERGTPAQAKEMAAQAIALFDREGAKAAFARFNERPAPDFKHLDLYIFVARARDAVILAHGADRSLLGIDAATLVDPKGLNIGRAILARATENGAWVDYGWKDPVSGKVLPKSSWVVRHKDYIFGCGVHKT